MMDIFYSRLQILTVFLTNFTNLQIFLGNPMGWVFVKKERYDSV
jgi:hypothetical protein